MCAGYLNYAMNETSHKRNWKILTDGICHSGKKKISKCRKFISRLSDDIRRKEEEVCCRLLRVFWPGVVRSVLGKVREKRQRTVHTPAELCVQQTRKKKSSFFFFSVSNVIELDPLYTKILWRYSSETFFFLFRSAPFPSCPFSFQSAEVDERNKIKNKRR